MTRKGLSFLDLTALPEVGALLLSPRPAWLWASDSGKVLWANVAGAREIGAASLSELVETEFPRRDAVGEIPLDVPQMIEVPAPGSEGEAVWCLCTRLWLADGSIAVLMIAADEEIRGDPVSIRAAHLVRFVADDEVAVVLARPDGRIVAASSAFAAVASGGAVVADLAHALPRDATPIRRRIAFQEERRAVAAVAARTDEGRFVLAIIGPPEAADERRPEPESQPAQESKPASEAAIANTDSGARPVLASGHKRFTFRLGPDLDFTAVSAELAAAVGTENADIVGRGWADIAARFGFDGNGAIARALERRDTWSSVTVEWPHGDSGETVAIDLTAIPSFGDSGRFDGFRGFGVVRADPKSAPPSPPSKKDGVKDQAAEKRAEQAEASVVQTPEPPPEDAAIVQPEPSNVVRLPSADRAPERAEALSGDEQDAFRRIADALRSIGARTGNEGERSSSQTKPVPAQMPEPPDAIPLRLLDRLPLGIVVFREQSVLFANRVLLDRLGYPSAEALMLAGGVDALFSEIAHSRLDEEEQTYQVPLRAADGSQFPANARLHIVPWDDGPATMLTVREPLGPNVSPADGDRGRILARIEELEAVLDTATDGALILDGDGHILSVNRSAEALFGIESDAFLGRPFTDLLAEESRKPASDYLDGLARNGVASVLNDGREVIGKVPAGGLIALFMTMGRLSERGKFCAVLRDITQWKNAEEELIAARRSAEIANRHKSDFLAKISHEIRTPLNAIIGFSDVILEERFGPIGVERYREYLKDIRLSGKHLMSLINDLLDLSKIESGKLELSFDSVSINQIVRESVALMQPEANRKRVIIRTSLADDVPRVVADERSLRQIALNLLSNAVKFNVAGGQVIVSTALDEGEVVLRIRDTGIGMSEKDIETALQPFQQIVNSGPTRFEGTGLGLPLTKALVEANRAAFAISSVPNEGTLVRISFPVERVLQP